MPVLNAVMNEKGFKVDLPPDVIAAFESVISQRAIPRKHAVGRLMNWFVDQPDVIQQSVLGQMPESVAPDVALLVLARQARHADPSRLRDILVELGVPAEVAADVADSPVRLVAKTERRDGKQEDQRDR